MTLPYATRCALQALRESSDERAQNAYALVVHALVSGDEADVKRAAEAMEQTRDLQMATIASMPTQCQTDAFRPLHEAAHSTLSSCGVQLPSSVLSELRGRDASRSVAYLVVVVVLVLLCVLGHAWIQKCKPAHLCAAR